MDVILSTCMGTVELQGIELDMKNSFTIKALVHLHFYAHIKAQEKSLGYSQLTIPLACVYSTCNSQSSIIILQIIK